MKIINASAEIMAIHGADLALIEQAGRTCYKSEDKIGPGTAEKFVASIIKRGHESVIEHSLMTVRFIVDRGVSHEIVRHRIASYSQESTRYANYSKDQFGNELTFIVPCFWAKDYRDPLKCSVDFIEWRGLCLASEKTYLNLLAAGATPQEARSVLPNSLKTEVVMSANFRSWRNFFKQRTAGGAHPQMREVTVPLLEQVRSRVPVVFENL
jgi:thymidylate synthase (FAD)